MKQHYEIIAGDNYDDMQDRMAIRLQEITEGDSGKLFGQVNFCGAPVLVPDSTEFSPFFYQAINFTTVGANIAE